MSYMHGRHGTSSTASQAPPHASTRLRGPVDITKRPCLLGKQVGGAMAACINQNLHSHHSKTSFTPPRTHVFRSLRYPLVPAHPGGEGGLTWSTAYVRPPNRCVGPARWRRSRCGAPSRPRCSDKSPNSLITKWAVEAMVTEDATSRPIATSGAAAGGANR